MKKLIYISVIIVGILFSSSFAQDRLKEAEDLIKKKDYEKAFLIAKESFKAEDYKTVERILISLREKNPSSKIYELLGDNYFKTKVYALALDNYFEAEKTDSLNIELKFKIAQVYYKEKQYKEAGNKLIDVIKIDSTNVRALYELGTLFYQARWYGEASLYLSKLVQYEKKLEYFQWLVKSFLEVKNFAKAYEYADKGLQLDKNDLTLLRYKFTAGLSLAGTDKLYQSEAAKLSRILPDSMVTGLEVERIAKVYQYIEKNDTLALEFYEYALEKADTLIESLTNAAGICFRLKKFDRAAKIYEKKLSKDSLNYTANKFRALALYQAGDYPAAIEAFKNTIAIADTELTIYTFLARTYIANKQENDAIDIYEIFLKKVQGREDQFKNEIADANGAVGLRYFASKRYDSAIPFLRKAVALQPNNTDYNLWLAACLHQTDKLDEAINFYKRVLKLDPKNQAATKALKSLGEL